MFHIRKLLGDARELLVGERDLFVGVGEPFIRARGQDGVGAPVAGSVWNSCGAPFPRMSPEGGRSGFHYVSKLTTLNADLTKA